jgi:glycosyltransferase involved in cell wall biosynthesis
MISVCIPVYNSDVRELVNALYEQGKKLKTEIEIIVIDDCSRQETKDVNRSFAPKINYIENQTNQGRARIRNQFLEFATQPFLLFIDGDSQLISKTFLSDYISELENKIIDVLCGASIYQAEKPKRKYYLRWKYSVNRESKNLVERLKNPSLGFKTNNFIIRKEIFQKIKFNETLLGYGHEDTLFGFELRQNEINIHHIENPVLNKNLDDNLTFLRKTDEGLKSLLQVVKIIDNNPDFIKNNKLLSVYYKVKKNSILKVMFNFSIIILPILTFFLQKGYFTLRMFDLYKLMMLEKIDIESC